MDIGHAHSPRKIGLCVVPRHKGSPRTFCHDHMKQIGSADCIPRLRVSGAPAGSLCHGREQTTIQLLGLDQYPLTEQPQQKLQCGRSVGLVFDAADSVLNFESQEPVLYKGLLRVEQFTGGSMRFVGGIQASNPHAGITIDQSESLLLRSAIMMSSSGSTGGGMGGRPSRSERSTDPACRPTCRSGFASGTSLAMVLP